MDSRPTAGIGDSGDAAVSWVHDIGRDRVLQASYRKGRSGTWPEPNDLSEASLQIRKHEIALDGTGNAVVAWVERADATHAVKAVVRSAGSGVWGARVTLSSGENVSAGPTLALAPNGTAIVAWVERSSVVRVATGDATTATWQLTSDLSRSANPVLGEPQAVLNAAGDGAVAWVQQASGESRPRVKVAQRSAGGSWTAPTSLRSVRPQPASDAAVGIDRTGSVVVGWIALGEVEAAAYSAATGLWTDPRIVADADPRATELQLAVNPSGNAIAAWSTNEGGSPRTAIRPAASGTWQAPATISASGSSHLRASLEASGNGTTVWNSRSGIRVIVSSARLDGRGPVIESIRAPRRLPVRVRAVFSATATAWAAPLVGLPRWSFGDGTSSTGARVTHAFARSGRFVVSVLQADSAGGISTRRATVIVGAPRNSTKPSIRGTVRQGSTLTCLSGVWAGARPISFAYQWLRNGDPIPGAKAARYRIRARDLGDAIGCRVRATNQLASTAALARPVQVDVG